MEKSRRVVLRVLGAGAMVAGLPLPLWSSTWNQSAFDARRMEDALLALGVRAPARSDRIRFDTPDIADNGAFVPVEVESLVANTESIALFIERNPYPYVARFVFAPEAVPAVALRLRFLESGPLHAVVRAQGRDYGAVRAVRVVAGGCAGDDSLAMASRPPGPIRMRARTIGGDTELRALLNHPMENGLRVDVRGEPIPAHFIREVRVELDGQRVLQAEFGRSVSSDPLLVFHIRGRHKGSRVTLRWEDSRSLSEESEVIVDA